MPRRLEEVSHGVKNGLRIKLYMNQIYNIYNLHSLPGYAGFMSRRSERRAGVEMDILDHIQNTFRDTFKKLIINSVHIVHIFLLRKTRIPFFSINTVAGVLRQKKCVQCVRACLQCVLAFSLICTASNQICTGFFTKNYNNLL